MPIYPERTDAERAATELSKAFKGIAETFMKDTRGLSALFNKQDRALAAKLQAEIGPKGTSDLDHVLQAATPILSERDSKLRPKIMDALESRPELKLDATESKKVVIQAAEMASLKLADRVEFDSKANERQKTLNQLIIIANDKHGEKKAETKAETKAPSRDLRRQDDLLRAAPSASVHHTAQSSPEISLAKKALEEDARMSKTSVAITPEAAIAYLNKAAEVQEQMKQARKLYLADCIVKDKPALEGGIAMRPLH